MYRVMVFVFTEAKHPAREANHSSPCSVEVKNAWSYNSTPPIYLHSGGCAVKGVGLQPLVGAVVSNLNAGIDVRLLCLLCT
jgi:hypothetical protein